MRVTPPNARQKLATNLTDTSKAYGYTLCVWGSGAVLISEYTFPTTMEVLLYVTGAVLGFGVLATIVYGTLFRNVEDIKDQDVLAATMIHLIAAPVTVIGAFYIAQHLPQTWGFLVAGINATASYNILLLIESVIYEDLRELEERLHLHEGITHSSEQMKMVRNRLL